MSLLVSNNVDDDELDTVVTKNHNIYSISVKSFILDAKVTNYFYGILNFAKIVFFCKKTV